MKFETHAKIGIWVGISMAVSLGILFGFTTSLEYQSEFKEFFLDYDKKFKEMKASNSLKLMQEKFPDLYVNEHNTKHNMEITAEAFNFETGNSLRLSVTYDIRNDRIREYVRCDTAGHDFQNMLSYSSNYANEFVGSTINFPMNVLSDGHAKNELSYDFIQYTNCLEIGTDNDVIDIVSPEYGDIPTFTISIPEGSDIPGCENIAQCFSPEEITIKKGDIIEWKNYDDSVHTVSSGDPENGPTAIFDSNLIEIGASFALKFNSVGEFDYFCMIHPWQTGSIIVSEKPVLKATRAPQETAFVYPHPIIPGY